jgi:gluconokinase
VNPPDAPTILTIDIGTTSTRAAIYDSHASRVDGLAAERYNELQTDPDGTAVFDAGRLFATLVEVIDEVIERAGRRASTIEAVALDTFVSNVLGLDASGNPVTSVYTYADTRNSEETHRLRTELGHEGVKEVHRRTGCLVHASYLPSRFLWMERMHPELLSAVRNWVTVGEFFFEALFGSRTASFSVASWSGLLDRHALEWDSRWLERLPIDVHQLSPLGDIDEPATGLIPNWASRWPSLANIPWLPAIGDGAAANIGSGCDLPSTVALTIGSTGAMRVVVDRDLPEIPDGLWNYRVDRSRRLLGGATTEGGNFFGWLRRTLQVPPADALEREIARREPAAHGLCVLPFVSGERAPGWRDDARAAFVGLSLGNDPIDMVQAALEGMAYRFVLIHERLAKHLSDSGSHRIIASGGALLSSPAWIQIMADALGETIETLVDEEITSRGLALLALEYLDIIESPSDLPPRTGVRVTPDGTRHRLHAQAVERQREVYEGLLGNHKS